MKSHRRKDGWNQAKKRARQEAKGEQGGKALLRMCPAWLEVTEEGTYRVLEKPAAAVRRIFTLAREGMGTQRIVKRLTDEGVPTIGSGQRWIRRYVHKILSEPAAMGAYQPNRTERSALGKRRSVPDGEVIPGHFPAIVTETEWREAQAALHGRADGKGAGRVGEGEPNLFRSLCRCALSGETLHLLRITAPMRNGVQKKHTYLAPCPEARATGKRLGVDYHVFETAILKKLRELPASDIIGTPAGAKDREAEEGRLGARLIDLDTRIEKAKAKARSADDYDGYLDLIEALRAEQKQASERLAELEQERATGHGADVGEMHSLVDLLATSAPDQVETLRRRLKVRLRARVSEILVVAVARGKTRLYGVQLWFRGSNRQRSYLIAHTTASRHGPGKVYPPVSPEKLAVDALDLRKRKDAQALEKLLLSIDLEKLLAIMSKGVDAE